MLFRKIISFKRFILIVQQFFFWQGVNLAKVIEAGDFICSALHRKTNSKVAQARGRTVWCVSIKKIKKKKSHYVPFKVLPLLLPPSDLLPLLSYASLNCQRFVIQKISRVIRKIQHCVLWSKICFLTHRFYFVNNVNIFCRDLGDKLNQFFDWFIFVLYACILQMNKNSLKKKYRIKDKYLSRRLFICDQCSVWWLYELLICTGLLFKAE